LSAYDSSFGPYNSPSGPEYWPSSGLAGESQPTGDRF
jgi:hypothetical protein